MSQGYEIELVQNKDNESILELLRRTFFIHEPVNQALGLCSDGTCTELEDWCKQSLAEEGYSFKAVDKEGNIVGVMINGINELKEGDGSDYIKLAEQIQNHKFKTILYVLAQREKGSKLKEKFPEEQHKMYVKIAATDPNWRNRGIMNALLAETEKITKQRGIRLLHMDTSSAYSAMAAEKLGFTCVYSAAYSDIKMDGRPLVLPEPPHVYDKVFIKTLF